MLALLGALTVLAAPGQVRDAPSGQVEDQLQDIVVEGRPLREAAVDFVDKVIGTARGNGAAAWRQTLCVGVGNLQREVAEHIIDRISTTAEQLGIELGRPGCEPRVFITFAADADETAQAMVTSRRREFRVNMAGADLGGVALRAFETSDAPVRWWHVILKVNPDTGLGAYRPPGDVPYSPSPELTRPMDFGDNQQLSTGSRLHRPLRDDLAQVIIVVDIDQVQDVSFEQLSAYLTMISLAQIDPAAEPGGYDTILNLFRAPESAPGDLTDWDLAFLRGVYGAEQNQGSGNARLGSVAAAMAQSVRNQQRAPERAP